MTTWVAGCELSATDKAYVLSRYVNRFTREHIPKWATRPGADGQPQRPRHASDADWLAHTRFAVREDGRLDRKVARCESTPTWPDGAPGSTEPESFRLVCACGEMLRWSRTRGQYEPLAAKVAQRAGHVVAAMVADGGARRTVRADAVCTAVKDELAARRGRRAS